MIWRSDFVHCVPVRISPVAVRLQYIRGRQLVLGMRFLGVGQATTEVGVVVGSVSLGASRSLSSASKQSL